MAGPEPPRRRSPACPIPPPGALLVERRPVGQAGASVQRNRARPPAQSPRHVRLQVRGERAGAGGGQQSMRDRQRCVDETGHRGRAQVRDQGRHGRKVDELHQPPGTCHEVHGGVRGEVDQQHPIRRAHRRPSQVSPQVGPRPTAGRSGRRRHDAPTDACRRAAAARRGMGCPGPPTSTRSPCSCSDRAARHDRPGDRRASVPGPGCAGPPAWVTGPHRG